MSNVTVQARIDRELKEEADAVLAALGLSTAEAIRIFLQQVVNSGGLPFRPSVKQPSPETQAALAELGKNLTNGVKVDQILFRQADFISTSIGNVKNVLMEAAVVARPDETWGETPCAFVTLKPDARAVAADDIIDYCRENMAHFKVPKTIVFGPLPKTSTGKIQKFVLRDRASKL